MVKATQGASDKTGASNVFKGWTELKEKKKKCCQGETIKVVNSATRGVRDKIRERRISRGSSDISGA